VAEKAKGMKKTSIKKYPPIFSEKVNQHLKNGAKGNGTMHNRPEDMKEPQFIINSAPSSQIGM